MRVGSDGDRRVSVIVPVFNVAPYLGECVDSVLHQTHAELEIVLVDDGSTDGSSEVCDAFADRDPRVRVIHQANTGLSAARNIGLASSSGSLVTFLDGDDWWVPGFVESLVQALEDHPSAGLAMSSFARVPGRAWTPHLPETSVMSARESVEHFAGPQHTLFTMACAKLYRRSVLDGVSFPLGRLHEDEFTTYKALMRAPAVIVPQPLYLYRQRMDGITASSLTPERLLDAIEAADQQAEDFLGAGLTRPAAWAQDQAFRKRLRLVALLHRLRDRARAAEHTASLARAARAGRSLPRSRAVRISRRMAAVWPRQTVRAFTMVGTVRGRIRQAPHA